MAQEDQHTQLIMRYLDGKLNVAEQQQFSELLETSEAFRQEVLESESVVAGIKALVRQQEVTELNAAFKKLEKEDRSVKRMKRRSALTPLGIAASLAVLMALAYLLWAKTSEVTTDQLFAGYYEVFPVMTSRNEKEVYTGLVLYNQDRYEESIPYLLREKESEVYRYTDLYLANAYLKTGKTANAIRELEAMEVAGGEQFLSQYKTWYLGLAYLKDGQKGKAEDQFIRLCICGGSYEREAREILICY